MEGYLSDQYVFDYLQTQSELLRDPDRLRVLSLGLSKKNKAVPAVCLIVAVLVNSMNGQVSSLQRKGFAADLHRPIYRLHRVEISDRTALLFAAVCRDFDCQRYLIKRTLQN